MAMQYPLLFPYGEDGFHLEIPYYETDENKKVKRKRQMGRAIGRIYYAHPTCGERYYLRILLNIVKGPKNYEEIRKIGTVTHLTFKETCQALAWAIG